MICRSEALTVFEDTRQKEGKHDNIHSCLQEMGVNVVRRCLSVGDYMLEGNDKVSVDTKSGILEVCTDLGADRARFNREMLRAKTLGIKLYILVEDFRFHSIADVATRWNNPISKKNPFCMDGKELSFRMRSAEIAYGVTFVFCRKKNAGRVVLKLLGVENECVKSKKAGCRPKNGDGSASGDDR